MSIYHLPRRDLWAAELRVLGWRRFAKDTIYWAWVSFWLGGPWGPLWALDHIPFMLGCVGYFDWRDTNDFPALSRWQGLRWHRWQQAAALRASKARAVKP